FEFADFPRQGRRDEQQPGKQAKHFYFRCHGDPECGARTPLKLGPVCHMACGDLVHITCR
ncbi:MAG: hypothetical protein Q8J60_03515, partial [Thiobacillus sp.]|nr:hypothetical protein [Thiobacillus sp.]